MRANPSKSALVLTLALAVGLAGCASGGGGGGSSRVAGSTTNRIVRAELDPLAQLDARQAVERLRPRWLQSRAGSTPVLYVDGSRRGGMDDLRSFRASEIEQIEYLSPSDATTRFGTGHTGGAVLVSSRR